MTVAWHLFTGISTRLQRNAFLRVSLNSRTKQSKNLRMRMFSQPAPSQACLTCATCECSCVSEVVAPASCYIVHFFVAASIYECTYRIKKKKQGRPRSMRMLRCYKWNEPYRYVCRVALVHSSTRHFLTESTIVSRQKCSGMHAFGV